MRPAAELGSGAHGADVRALLHLRRLHLRRGQLRGARPLPARLRLLLVLVRGVRPVASL